MGTRLLFLLLFPALSASAQDLLQRYFESNLRQADRGRDIHMDMDFDARLPKLKKVAHFTGTRFISKAGRVAFKVKSLTGDDTAKKYVITRYLSAEQENSEKPQDNGITPANYKFKFKRIVEEEGRQVHIYEVQPRKKRVGLFKGELAIDEETALPVRESGQFVKSPSPLFLKKVSFIRNYQRNGDFAHPSRIESVVETRIAGKAEITINYANLAPGGDPDAAEPAPVTTQ